MLKKCVGSLLLMGLLVLTGCRKWQIESELKQLNTQQATCQEELDSFDETISSLKKEVAQVEAQIRKRNSETGAYLQNHVLAVTCMAAVGYSVSDDNLFSDDVNKMVNVGSVLCVAGAILSEDFRSEVDEVVQTLEHASKEVKQLQGELASLRSKLATELQGRAGAQKRYDQLSQKIRSLNDELAKL